MADMLKPRVIVGSEWSLKVLGYLLQLLAVSVSAMLPSCSTCPLIARGHNV